MGKPRDLGRSGQWLPIRGLQCKNSRSGKPSTVEVYRPKRPKRFKLLKTKHLRWDDGKNRVSQWDDEFVPEKSEKIMVVHVGGATKPRLGGAGGAARHARQTPMRSSESWPIAARIGHDQLVALSWERRHDRGGDDGVRRHPPGVRRHDQASMDHRLSIILGNSLAS